MTRPLSGHTLDPTAQQAACCKTHFSRLSSYTSSLDIPGDMSRFYDTMRHAYWRAKGLPVPPLVLDDHASPISSVAFLPNSTQVVGGFRGGSVQTWRVEDGREVGKVMKQGNATIPVTVSSDGHWIASGGEEKKVTIWDATTHETSSSWRATMTGCVRWDFRGTQGGW
jgi:WD40 repeat protein